MSTREETITTKEYSYTVVLEPAEEGGYTVTCPILPGLVTEGDTLEEARVMAADAIRCYLESLKKDEMPIPVEEEEEDEPLREKITVYLTKV
jgi:antitoxin HicB